MATLNEVKYAALKAALSATGGKINELEYRWLRDVQGRSGTLNEMWVEEFLAAGVTPNPWNSMAYEYLGLNGSFQKTLNERWYEFWSAGGAGGISLISNTLAVAALWTVRGTNTVVDNVPANAVEITNVDTNGGCYLRLATSTILSEALVDGTNYRIVFDSKTAGVFYLGLSDDTGNRLMVSGTNGVNFTPVGSTDLAATFLNISLPEGIGQVEAIGRSIRVWKIT
jgi:hypothetical protein